MSRSMADFFRAFRVEQEFAENRAQGCFCDTKPAMIFEKSRWTCDMFCVWPEQNWDAGFRRFE
jgi:hypothetical protein